VRGHTRRRGKTWSIVLDVGTDKHGKRRQKWHSGYATKKEAEAAMTRLLGQLQDGGYVEPSRLTLGRFLEESWLPSIRASVRELTYGGYERSVRIHIAPRLGDVPLQQLTPAKLNGLYAELLDHGRVDGKGLSPGSVRQVHLALHGALAAAVRWGNVNRNVAALADPPRAGTTREMRVWNADELGRFLTSTKGDRLAPLYHVLASTGMRRGEALGGRWGDLDLDNATWQVRRTLLPSTTGGTIDGAPKTARGRRSVALDAGTVKVLRNWRRAQLEERLAWGAGVRAPAACSPVRTAQICIRHGCRNSSASW
jgi:integrase